MDNSVQPGTVIAGKYVVESLIGSGGMGIVVKARQSGLDRPVAIKVLLQTHRERVDFVERFYREARAAARIHGEHVAQVFDVGKTDDGDPYLAMEFLDGEDLGKTLKREKRLPLSIAAIYMQHACSGVSEAHAARVVHRDLKPANLFLAQGTNGRTLLKVIDFGISKLDDGPSKLTSTQTSLGTAYYMAPEQIERPKEVDGRADIWALGVIFFELVTGALPFAGETIHQIIAAILRNQRQPARAYNPGLPPEVDAIIDRCLAPLPQDRFPTAADLASAIAALPNVDPRLAPQLSNTMGMQYVPAAFEVAPIPDLILPSAGMAVRPAGERAPVSSGAKRATSLEIDSLDLGGAPQLELARPMQAPKPQSMRAQPPLSVVGTRQTAPTLRTISTRKYSSSGGGKTLLTIGGGAVALALVVAISLVVALPRIAASSIHDAALGAGITVTHDAPEWSGSGVDLANFEATIPDLPGTTIHAKNAHASFSGGNLVLREVEAISTRPLDELSRAATTAETSLPKNIRLEDLHVTLALGVDVTVESTAGTLTQKVNKGARTTDIVMPSTFLRTPAGAFGPFDVHVERAAGRTVLTAVPAGDGPDAANAVVTWENGTTHIVVRVPHAVYHAPVQSLGITPEDSLDFEGKLDATIGPEGSVAGTGSVSFFKLTIGAQPMDVVWDFTLAGKDSGLLVRNVRAQIGPFSGEMHGQWAESDRKNAYVDFHTNDTSCADVARAKAHQGNVPAILADLAQFAGIAKIKGQAVVSGVVTFMLDKPPRLSTSMSKNDTCGLVIFPGQ